MLSREGTKTIECCVFEMIVYCKHSEGGQFSVESSRYNCALNSSFSRSWFARPFSVPNFWISMPASICRSTSTLLGFHNLWIPSRIQVLLHTLDFTTIAKICGPSESSSDNFSSGHLICTGQGCGALLTYLQVLKLPYYPQGPLDLANSLPRRAQPTCSALCAILSHLPHHLKI